MRFLSRRDQRGILYPVSILFFAASLSLLLHSTALYVIHLHSYEGLENSYRNATILLLDKFEQEKVPKQ